MPMGSVYAGTDRRDPDAAVAGDASCAVAAPIASSLLLCVLRGSARSRSTSPRLLIHLRNKVVQAERADERRGDWPCGQWECCSVAKRRFRAAQRMGRMAESPLVGKDGWIGWLPGLLGGWTQVRDLQGDAEAETFRELVGEAGFRWQITERVRQERQCWRGFARRRVDRLRLPWFQAEWNAIPRTFKRQATLGHTADSGAVDRPADRLRRACDPRRRSEVREAMSRIGCRRAR